MSKDNLEKQSQVVVAEANALAVTNSDENVAAVQRCKIIKDLMKEINEHHQPSIDAAHAAHKAALAARDKLVKPLDQAYKLIKSKINDFSIAEQKRLAEEARLAKEEADRKEQERLLKIAALKEKAGKTEEAKKVVAEAEQVDMPLELPKPVSKAEGQVTTEVWDIEILDKAKIPDEYKTVDTSALKAEARRLKIEGEHIPGVRFVKTLDTRIRT